jgi:chromosomal replication initiation ATPase DnaA
MANPNSTAYWRDHALDLQERVRALEAKLETERQRSADAETTLIRMRMPTVQATIAADSVLRAAAAACDLETPEAITSDSRERNALDARLITYRLLRDALNWGPKRIGVFLGRDHSTVIVGINRTVGLAKIDPAFRARLQTARETIKGARQSEGVTP